MTKTMKFAVALALVMFAVTIATAGINYNSRTDAAALPLSGTPGNETPVRATKATGSTPVPISARSPV
jgi:hypothetical protein